MTGLFWADLIIGIVVRHAGLDAVREHWPGTDDGFKALARLTGRHRAT